MGCEIAAILAELPEVHRGWVEFAYTTGWRKNEVLNLRWAYVEKDGVRLPASFSKNKEPRWFPLNGQLATVLDRQRASSKRCGTVSNYVFAYPHGSRIKYPEYSFQQAAERAGYPGALIHDLKRSAVRNLSRLGISQNEIMRLVGLKTDSIFRRYDIIDESRLEAAAEKIDTLGAMPEKGAIALASAQKAHNRGVNARKTA